jgi:hypothetical protein
MILPPSVSAPSSHRTGDSKSYPSDLHCYKDYLKWSSPLENCSSRNEKSPLLMLEHFAPCPYWYFTSFYAVKIFRSQKQELLRGATGKFRKILKFKMCGKTAGDLPHGEGKSRVHSRAPSIRSHRGIKVVWPDFQPMRVPEEPVCVHLFRQKPVFTSLHLKSPVHVHRLRT